MVGSCWILILMFLAFVPSPSSAVTTSEIEKITAAAESGDSTAQYNLGMLHYYGDGVKKDFAVAAGWFTKAVEQREPNSAYMIAVMLNNGEGFIKNVDHALEWIRCAAELGSPEAKESVKQLAPDEPSRAQAFSKTRKGNPESNLTTKEKGGTLSIEAGIVYLHGGPQPVARTVFYLFDKNPDLLWMELAKPWDAFVDKKKNALGAKEPIRLSAVFGNLNGILFYRRDEHELPYNSLIQQSVQSVKTDFGGKAIFNPVLPGLYYVFGVAMTRRSTATWIYPVEIQQGEQLLTLDQNNAVRAY